MDAGVHVLLLGVLLVASCHGQQVTVTVDSNADNSNCISAQDLLANGSLTQSTCTTINEALGNAACSDDCTRPLVPGANVSNVSIRLADGDHQLTGTAYVDVLLSTRPFSIQNKFILKLSAVFVFI